MMVLLASTETEEDLKKLHDQIGHTIFATLALDDDEEKKVDKVHRYFGHRSGRRVWDLFSKSNALQGKRKAVLDLIDKCKICSKMRKSPTQTQSQNSCGKRL
jgi:hypothetical protein